MGREEVELEYIERFGQRVYDRFVLSDDDVEKLMAAALKRGSRVTDEEVEKALDEYDTDPMKLY